MTPVHIIFCKCFLAIKIWGNEKPKETVHLKFFSKQACDLVARDSPFACVYAEQVNFDAAVRFGSSRFSQRFLLESYYVITNLRYIMSSLFTLSTVPENERNTLETRRYYFGVYEFNVISTCHCFGHSDVCIPAPGDMHGVSV